MIPTGVDIEILNNEVRGLSTSFERAMREGEPRALAVLKAFKGARGADTLLARAYRTFYIRGSNVVLDWHSWLLAHEGLEREQFVASLWLAYKDALKVHRPTRQGHYTQSLESLWVEVFADRVAKGVSRAEAVRWLHKYLAQQCLGMVAEYQVVCALRERGFEVVVADSDHERLDVDCWVNGVPCSIKTYRAFCERTITYYRTKSAVPRVYISERLESITPYGDRLVYRDPERLEGVLTYLSHTLCA